MVVREAPERIDELIRWGTHFDLTRGQPGPGPRRGTQPSSHRPRPGRRHRQGSDAGRDRTDRAADERRNLATRLHARSAHARRSLPRRAGLERRSTARRCVWAKQTILCTGGAGQIYRETTNPDVATGDGLAMAYRAGAELRDMEFMQFHPTVLYIAGCSRNLITEAMRGEGARLVDRHGLSLHARLRRTGRAGPARRRQPGDRRADGKDAASERLSRSERISTPSGCGQRFPGIAAICAEFGIDIASDWIPVRPGAHYMIGGVTVDTAGRTTLPGLWAAGEVTSSGLHGANRLASNSLLEGLVYGAHAGRGRSASGGRDGRRFSGPAAGQSGRGRQRRAAGPGRHPQLAEEPDVARRPASAARGPSWPRRPRTSTTGAATCWPGSSPIPEGWQLQNMLTVARIMIAAALEREETRGVHLRTDFPGHGRRPLAAADRVSARIFVAAGRSKRAGRVACSQGLRRSSGQGHHRPSYLLATRYGQPAPVDGQVDLASPKS